MVKVAAVLAAEDLQLSSEAGGVENGGVLLVIAAVRAHREGEGERGGVETKILNGGQQPQRYVRGVDVEPRVVLVAAVGRREDDVLRAGPCSNANKIRYTRDDEVGGDACWIGRRGSALRVESCAPVGVVACRQRVARRYGEDRQVVSEKRAHHKGLEELGVGHIAVDGRRGWIIVDDDNLEAQALEMRPDAQRPRRLARVHEEEGARAVGG